MDDIKRLKPEDYEEPACLLCMDDENVTRIDTRRFIEKLDAYYAKNDYDGACRHLGYWLTEAITGGDLRGQFTVYNEMMGYYRKTGQREKAFEAVDNALDLIPKIGIEGGVSAGTAYVNAATVCKTFGESEKAMPWFEKAQLIYEKELPDGDGRLGGLYNNMALALADLHRYEQAIGYYEKAIGIMMKVKNGELEAAVSYLNMANAREAMLGLEGAESYINEYLDKAEQLLDTPSLPRDGYYAFVCEKCAPTFQYYGYFLFASKLKETARSIYERA
ncbi:MAG: tetratricopeptide repeat protein [Clostridia bacterium]|nr:tetratricopeptide repeat protein [Clostridia bacterium]